MSTKIQMQTDFAYPEPRLDKKWSGKKVVHDAFNPPADPGISFTDDPGMTDQSQARDCDINLIVDRYMKTGVLPGVDREAMFDDFTQVRDYHDAMNIVIRAQEQFESLDAHVRKQFDNDPARFLEFATNPKNGEELVKMGLATPRATEPEKSLKTKPEAFKTVPKKEPSTPAGGEGSPSA